MAGFIFFIDVPVSAREKDRGEVNIPQNPAES